MWLGKEEEKPLTAEPIVPELKTNSCCPTIKEKTCQSKAAAGEWWQQSRRSKEGEIASEPDVKPCWYGVYLLDVQRDCLLPNQVIPSTMRHIIQCTDSFSTFGC